MVHIAARCRTVRSWLRSSFSRTTAPQRRQLYWTSPDWRLRGQYVGERSHRSLSPSANRPAQLAGPTHPPQTRRPHPHCPPTRRDVPRAVAAPSPASSVSKLAAVDSVTTWVLRLSRDGHIGSLECNLDLLLGLCASASRAPTPSLVGVRRSFHEGESESPSRHYSCPRTAGWLW